jgi:hypothetical protein
MNEGLRPTAASIIFVISVSSDIAPRPHIVLYALVETYGGVPVTRRPFEYRFPDVHRHGALCNAVYMIGTKHLGQIKQLQHVTGQVRHHATSSVIRADIASVSARPTGPLAGAHTRSRMCEALAPAEDLTTLTSAAQTTISRAKRAVNGVTSSP